MPYKMTDEQRAYQRAWARKRRERAKATTDALKSTGCEVCGETFLGCLDFHHVDPSTKNFTIGGGSTKKGGPSTRMRTPAAIREEAKKCVVLCRNCHAKVHAGAIEVSTGSA